MQYEGYIIKHLKGELSEEETHQLNEWLSSNANNQQLFDNFKNTWEKTGEFNFKPNKELAWKKVNQKIEKQYQPQFKWLLRIAAVFVLGISTWGYFQYKNNATTTVLAKNNSKNITLPDGSKITLNNGASIEYADFTNKKNRMVTLKGEAFFDVVKDKKHPFIVECETFNIKVLGTSFNINNSTNNKTEVAVFTGTVLMSSKNNQVKLTKNQSAILNKKGQVIKTLFSHNSIAWKTGTLVFNHTKLTDVATAINKRYAINITLTNKKNDHCTFTGEFNKTTTLQEVFLVIEKALNITVKKENNQHYIWEGKGC